MREGELKYVGHSHTPEGGGGEEHPKRESEKSGSFGQIYCLNGLKIKDDSANYTRLYVRAVVDINFGQET